MIAFRHKIRKMLDRPFLAILWLISGYLLYDVFDEISNSVHLSEHLANVIKVSEERWKTTQQSFQKIKGHMEAVNLRIR